VSYGWSLAILFVTVLGVTATLGAPMILLLRRLSVRQKAYEDAPKTHEVKTGTPTMGGLLFVFSLLMVLAWRQDFSTIALVALGIGCAIVGFIDDFSAIRSGRNRGLRARTKFLATFLVGVVFLALLQRDPEFARSGILLVAGGWTLHAPYAVWYGLSLLAIVGTTHAVNLTDGLDGLATGTILPPLAVLAWIAIAFGIASVAYVAIALAAGAVGFLLYNKHPARVFMGDTGSLALGGVLAGCAIVTGEPLLLPLIGGVFVAEALSVILQVVYFKRTKKRIFRMSPLHHHFELGGISEPLVTQRFWAASLALSLAGAAVVR
jgi:phospho-N-acetylmuramoyl-pentapeptide-transferase